MKPINIQFAQPTIKLAMSVPASPEIKEEGKKQGIFFDPEAAETPQDLSIVNSLKAAGIEKFALPKIYHYKDKDVRTINGKKYLIVTVDKSGKDPIKNPGLIRGINIETGNVESFTYVEAFDQIRGQSEAISEKTRKKINESIKEFNASIARLDLRAANLTNFPLRLESVKLAVDKRIKALDEIIQRKQQEKTEVSNKPSALINWEKYIEQQMGSSTLSERDLTDYIFAKYPYHYDQLKSDLENGTLKIPSNANIPNTEEYKQKLLSAVNIVLEKMKEEKASKLKREKELAEKPAFDITNQKEITEMQEVEKTPVSHKSRGSFSFESGEQSIEHAISGSKQKRDKLAKISTMLETTAEEIGRWPDKSIASLKKPDGRKILDYFKTLCNEGLKSFTEDYSRDIVDDQGRLDHSKFSSEGGLGNAELVVMFTKLYQTISFFFKELALPPPIMPSSPVIPDIANEAQRTENVSQTPSVIPSQTPVQASSKLVIKISKSDWKNLR